MLLYKNALRKLLIIGKECHYIRRSHNKVFFVDDGCAIGKLEVVDSVVLLALRRKQRT